MLIVEMMFIGNWQAARVLIWPVGVLLGIDQLFAFLLSLKGLSSEF
jgi:hypothetical protein